MYYLSNKTISLLAELGDLDCQYFCKHSMSYAFGFVARNGNIKYGPLSWDDNVNKETAVRINRFNHLRSSQVD